MKIRDRQKGIIFIFVILIMIIGLSVFFSFFLKTNVVSDKLKTLPIMRTLFIVEDEDNSVLFSSVLIYSLSEYKAALINIPNYTGSIFKSLGRVDKITQVYTEKGIESYKSEVEKMLGVEIPFYVVMKTEQFMQFCDYLCGIRVFISEPIDLVQNEKRFLLPSGVINLDGDKINTYLHYRFEDENLQDIQERYQNVMAGFFTSLHDQKYKLFNKNVNKIFHSFFSANVNDDEKQTLFESIGQIDCESLIKQTITGSLRRVDGELLLFPDNNSEFIKEAVKQTTNMLISSDGSLTSRVYIIEIQNGTNIQGLARNTAILFQNASYDVLSPVNANRQDYEETIIIDHIGNSEVSKAVGEFIRCKNIVQESTLEEEYINSEATVDFTIILGKDFNGRYVVSK